MGYSTIMANSKDALRQSKNMTVISASVEAYFTTCGWRKHVALAEYGDNGRVYFTLKNGDFVEME